MFAGCTQTVPKQRKTLKSQGFQGCLVRETGLEPLMAFSGHFSFSRKKLPSEGPLFPDPRRELMLFQGRVFRQAALALTPRTVSALMPCSVLAQCC